MKNYSGVATLLLFLFFPPLPGLAEQPGKPAGPGGVTRTGSGLVLRKSGVDHIQSVLGPTLVFRLNLASDTSHMCYTSTATNSLIAFEIEDQRITRIQVMADKHHYNRWDWCTTMPLSADDLALANGVALGLEPTDAANLLGTPGKKDGDRWYYAYRPEAPVGRERVRPLEDPAGHCVQLGLEFTGSRLIRFDLRAGSMIGKPAPGSP